MGSARLVTLIGPGGIGKTRLAEEMVHRLHRARRTPVFAVRLARLPKGSGAAVVREAVTASVLVEGFVGASAWDGAVQRLSAVDAAERAVATVLLVDNCEHVSAGVGAVVAELLEAVAGLTIVATSREPLGWIDEQLVTVPPLSGAQSLQLFRQRAELAGYPVTEPGQVAVAKQICEHMHGNPLFIRLAAARMFYEPLPIILEQLSGESGDRRMRWRHGRRVVSEQRHRGIGDVILWSYELCGDKERLLFDRLSVFAPGYDVNPQDADTAIADVGADLEGIEVVCADDVAINGCEDPPTTADTDQAGPAVGLARSEIRDLLERLVEQSLVSIHTTADRVQYFQLESLRLFAAERLAERSTEVTDEPARLARRHCYYYRDTLLQGQVEWFRPAERELLNWTMGAWSNIRCAIDTSMAAGEPVVGLQIALQLLSLRALFLLGSLTEIRVRIEQTLAAMQASDYRSAELELLAMAQLTWLALFQGRPQDAGELLERCVAACGAPAARAGRWRDRPDTDIGLPAVVDHVWGVELMLVRRDPRAIAVFARARKKFHGLANRDGEGVSEQFEAVAAGLFGSAEQAIRICQRHLERTTAAGSGLERSWAQYAMALALTKHGDVGEALRLGRDAIAYLLAYGDRWGSTWAVHVRMWSLARLITDHLAAGNTPRSTLAELATEIAYLAGGLQTHRAQLGVLIENMGPLADETRTAESVAHLVLGPDSYTDAEKRGSQLAPERFEVHRLALGTLSINASPLDRPARKGASPQWQSLSKAEFEVAILAAAGWPNSAIGVRRGTSTRTVDAQVSSIFQKLMINAREEIIRFVPEDQRRRLLAERSRLSGEKT